MASFGQFHSRLRLSILINYLIFNHFTCFCFFLVPVFDRGRYGIYNLFLNAF